MVTRTRTRSRRARSAAVSPPLSGYLMILPSWRRAVWAQITG
jgi:hypothetical protein